MASSSPIRVVEQTEISPEPGTGAASLPLTHYDLPWFSVPFGVARLFMYSYPHPTADFIAHHLPALKSSLSHTLRRFFPLSGRLHGFEIRYAEGEGSVPFTVAESDDDFRDLCGDHPRRSDRLSPLVPFLRGCDMKGASPSPLLAVQVTLFPGSGGLSIGISYIHAACDGLSFMQFVRSWAAANNDAAAAPPPPCFDRAWIADPATLCSRFLEAMPPPPAVDMSVPDADLFLCSFSLSRDDIERLKRKALGEASAPFPCSAFVVTIAHAWSCLFKALGGGAGERVQLSFTADYRGRMTPPLPAEYFGNCLRPCHVEMSLPELVSNHGFVAAAEAIGRAIEGLRAEIDEEGMFQELLSVHPRSSAPFMSVVGTPRAGVYGVDFGWGKPQQVEMPLRPNWLVSLAESRDETGGTQIGVALPMLQMDLFRSHFHDK